MTLAEFRENILSSVELCPKDWRKGQAIFNVLDGIGIARKVQFEDGVDCFYNDEQIDRFIECAYNKIKL